MALVKAGDCLHNCLREVHLEKFHRNFIERGLTNCDQLGCLPMDQYSQFGVVSMDDRKRLFSIIEIIKSVKADGILCQHGTSPLDRAPENPAVRKNEEDSRATVNENLRPTRSNNLTFAPKKLTYSEHENQRRPDEGKEVTRPTNNYKVAVERSAEEDLRQKEMMKRGVISTKNPDSPMFQCRKTLNFSDPDFYSDEELPPKSKMMPAQDVEPAVKVPYFNFRQTNKRSLPSNGNYKSSKDNKIGSGDASNPPRGVASSRNQRLIPTKEEKINEGIPVSRQDSNTVINAALRTRKIVETGQDAVSSRSATALSKSDGENTSSGNNNARDFISSKTNNNANPSNVSSVTAFSSILAFNSKPNSARHQTNNVIKKEFVSAPKHFVIDLKPMESSEHEKPMRGLWQHPSRNNLDRNHAYFPAPEPVGPASKPIHVEQIIHSGGYNYGIPDGSSKTQNATLPQTDENNRSANGILYPEKIRVCVRKRPRNAKELKRNDRDVIRIRGQQSVVVEEVKVAIDLTKYIHQHVLKFDEVFGDKCSNQDVYERAVKPLIACVFDRGSAICFAFGQTGAGKTHTLMGSKGVPGMYQLAGQDLFAIAHSGRYREPLRLWISFYEIYCGHLYDLLNKRKRLHVRENGRQKVCVAGLMENPVPDIDSLIKVISYGNSFRSRGSTGVNPHSSRSHALLQMDIRDAHDNKVGRLTFIDLAGSERASDATNLDRQTRIEGAEINQSLLALKECIRSIDQESGHTPYRQSKLTHILRDSFLGNSQTVMIANVSPTQTACENTLNTLRYADRVQELRKEVAVRSRRSTSPPVNAESHTNSAPPHGPSPAGEKRQRQAPSVFHPSDIQFSSTPMKNSGSSVHVAPPADLSDILRNGVESPLSGHKIIARRHRDAEERLSPVAISPIGELLQVYEGDDHIENRRKSSDGISTETDQDRGFVFPKAGRSSLGSSSPERRDRSQEGGETRNPHPEVAVPCSCKSEEDVTGLKDSNEELLMEQRRIKTQAELVISRVKSVMAQASSFPHPFVPNGPARQESDRALFLETKACMENARDNIRDFLDNERKGRAASEPGTSLQRELRTKSVEKLDVWAMHPDSHFQFSTEVLPHETQRLQEERNEATDKQIEQMENVETRTGFLNGSNQSGAWGNLVSAPDSSHATRELRSWAAILQDSSDIVNNGVGIDAIGQLPGSRRVSVEPERDSENGRLLLGSSGPNGGVEDDGEGSEDGDEGACVDEEVPSFVVSKEVQLLQLKIRELKLQKSRLEMEQRLFDENQRTDCEQFRQTFLSGGFDSRFLATTSNSRSVLNRVSPTKGSRSTRDSDIERETNDRRTSDEQRQGGDASVGQISPDQNGNFNKFFSRDFPSVEEGCGKEEHTSSNIQSNRVKNLESVDTAEEGHGSRQKEAIDSTRLSDDRVRFHGNKATFLLPKQFGRGVPPENGISADDLSLHFSDELACPSKIADSSRVSRQESADVVRLRSPRDDFLRRAEGATDKPGMLTLHQNSAFTKVEPSTNDSANNSQPNDAVMAQRENVRSKDRSPFEALTSTERCLSLPVGDLAANGFEPIESFPVTPRARSESDANERMETKEWNNSDDNVGSSVDKSNSELLQEAAVLERTRTLLVTAHEDQLTAVTHLCKQEMSLLVAFRSGQMDYDKYMESIRDILRTKSKIIQALVEHIDEFHTTSTS